MCIIKQSSIYKIYKGPLKASLPIHLNVLKKESPVFFNRTYSNNYLFLLKSFVNLKINISFIIKIYRMVPPPLQRSRHVCVCLRGGVYSLIQSVSIPLTSNLHLHTLVAPTLPTWFKRGRGGGTGIIIFEKNPYLSALIAFESENILFLFKFTLMTSVPRWCIFRPTQIRYSPLLTYAKSAILHIQPISTWF